MISQGEGIIENLKARYRWKRLNELYLRENYLEQFIHHVTSYDVIKITR